MSRWRRFLANPYKIQTAGLLLTRPFRRRSARWKLKNLSPANLSQLLGISGKPLAYFQNRPQPAFFFDPENIPKIISSIPQSQKKTTINLAQQQTMHRTFSFRSHPPVSFPDGFNWDFLAADDPDWHRDLHRLDWLIDALLASYYTGEESYAAAAGQALVHWWQENPPGSPPWSDPFEVAQRAHTLTWILYLGMWQPFFPEPAWEIGLCSALASAAWLSASLEFQTPNNHLLIELIRLFELGLLFPEYPAALNWQHTGAAFLARDIQRQVLPDGFHCELSVFYHRIVLEALLELIALSQKNNVEFPGNSLPAVANMLRTLHLVRRPDGSYPLWGDGFQSDTLLRYDLPAAGAQLLGCDFADSEPAARTLWFLNGAWPRPASTPPPAAHFWPDAGYAVLTRPAAHGLSQLTFDAGAFGLAAAPGHGHPDCLSITLNLGCQPVLVDPGTYSFRNLTWRQAFRGTVAHNTIVVDRQDQTPITGLFGAGPFARPRVDNAILTDGIRFFDACHDGYARLPQAVWHRRLLLDLPGSGWLIIDSLTGQGKHHVDLNWHFHPNIRILKADSHLLGTADGKKVIQAQFCSSIALDAQLVNGQADPPLGWFSEDSGSKIPAPVWRLSGDIECPACLATLFNQALTDSHPTLDLRPRAPGYYITIKHQGHLTSMHLNWAKPTSLSLDCWQAQGSLLLCHQTPATLEFLLVNGDSIRKNQHTFLSLANSSRGLILSQHPTHLQLSGDVPLPVEISSPVEVPVVINGKPAQTAYDPSKCLLRIPK